MGANQKGDVGGACRLAGGLGSPRSRRRHGSLPRGRPLRELDRSQGEGEGEPPEGLDPLVQEPRRIPLHDGGHLRRRSPAESPDPVAPRLAFHREGSRRGARDKTRRRRYPVRGWEDHREAYLLQDLSRDRGSKDPPPST